MLNETSAANLSAFTSTRVLRSVGLGMATGIEVSTVKIGRVYETAVRANGRVSDPIRAVRKDDAYSNHEAVYDAVQGRMGHTTWGARVAALYADCMGVEAVWL